MTVVCCWRDNSFTPPRMVAVADRRLSSKVDGQAREVHTDDAIKLFAAPVNCFDVQQLATEKVLAEPYHMEIVGLGFSGSAFEGLHVSTLIMRAFAQLVALNQPEEPEPEKLAELADELLRRFLTGHSRKASITVRILMFGWHRDRPWVAALTWWSVDKKPTNALPGHAPLEFQYVNDDAIFWIGGHEKLGRNASNARQTQTRKKSANPVPAEDDLREALHRLALSRAVEDALITVLRDPDADTVGGVFDKLELVRREEDVVAAFSGDDDITLFHDLPSVSSVAAVGHVPIVEPLGSAPGAGS